MITCAVCPDPTRPGLVTCSPRCAVELARRFAEHARNAHSPRSTP